MCRVYGGSINPDESLQITNASPNITTLTFTSTSFTSIPLNTFTNYPKVGVFYVVSNNLDSFPESSFQNATKLKTLFFSDNLITSIPDQAFKLCTALTSLSIYNNPITKLSGNPFQGLSKLTSFILGGLVLETFDPDVLADLSVLQNFNVQNCSLTNIPQNFFANNPKLTEINLSNNQITTIEDGAFDNLKYLSNLDVTYNNIVALSTSYAQTISAYNNKLKHLHIGSTAITVDVNNNFISNLTCDTNLNVQYFYATSNRISRPLCVGKMNSAKLITINSNRLGKISKTIFANLKNVSSFFINDNPQLKIGSGMISSMSKLKYFCVDKLVTGYMNLRSLFPKLEYISLTTRNMSCTNVKRIADSLNTQKIYLYFNNFTLDQANFKCQLPSWNMSYF